MDGLVTTGTTRPSAVQHRGIASTGWNSEINCRVIKHVIILIHHQFIFFGIKSEAIKTIIEHHHFGLCQAICTRHRTLSKLIFINI